MRSFSQCRSKPAVPIAVKSYWIFFSKVKRRLLSLSVPTTATHPTKYPVIPLKLGLFKLKALLLMKGKHGRHNVLIPLQEKKHISYLVVDLDSSSPHTVGNVKKEKDSLYQKGRRNVALKKSLRYFSLLFPVQMLLTSSYHPWPQKRNEMRAWPEIKSFLGEEVIKKRQWAPKSQRGVHYLRCNF